MAPARFYAAAPPPICGSHQLRFSAVEIDLQFRYGQLICLRLGNRSCPELGQKPDRTVIARKWSRVRTYAEGETDRGVRGSERFIIDGHSNELWLAILPGNLGLQRDQSVKLRSVQMNGVTNRAVPGSLPNVGLVRQGPLVRDGGCIRVQAAARQSSDDQGKKSAILQYKGAVPD